MSQTENHEEDSRRDPPEKEPADLEALGLLRSLLIGEEQTKLTQIEERLEDPELRAEDISRVLPEAVLIRMSQDEKLARALAPTMEDSFQVSVRRHPRVLVDVIAPIMGPAIRRAILQTINGMVESLNQTLEHSLSRRGLKWRWEALRTGKPFAEVVLLHTLVYQVEQVFLIHRESGLLLQHVVASSIEAMDADMVSGMLTAIQDFVHDSFGGDRDEGVNTLQVGERTVWVEQGPQAVLAAVTRGSAPTRLRQVFQEALESIHLEQKEALQEFAGDAVLFEASRMHLEDCLQSQFHPEVEERKRKKSPLFWLLLIAAVGLLGTWSVSRLMENRRWNEALERLDAEPGILVTQSGFRDGRRFVAGMRDPLAADPERIVAEAGVGEVVGLWEPYISFTPEFSLRRCRDLLHPPEGVTVELVEGVLHLSGNAPHDWILTAERLAPAAPGVSGLDTRLLRDVDLEELAALEEDVEGHLLHFATGSSRLDEAVRGELDELAVSFLKVRQKGRSLGKDMRLLVSGFTNESGREEENRRISQERADSVAVHLAGRGVSPRWMEAAGLGRWRGEEGMEGDWSRAVGFSVVEAGVDY